jgi:ubiquitin-like 1-activating enzyme E1 A
LTNIKRAEAATPAIQELNPRVIVNFDTAKITERIQDQAFLSSFDIVIATDVDYSSLSLLNTACRLSNKPFYAAACHGFYGYVFVDLISHEFIIEGDKPNIPAKPGQEALTRSILSVKIDNGKQVLAKRETYSPIMLANTSPLPTFTRRNRAKLRKVTPLLSCLRALWEFEALHNRAPMAGHEPASASVYASSDVWEFTRTATEKHNELGLPSETLKADYLRKFLQNIYSQIAPVTAMLGGLLAQDVINVIGKRQQPIQNFLLFDGDENQWPIFALHPGNFEDGTSLANGTAPVTAAAATLASAASVAEEIIT